MVDRTQWCYGGSVHQLFLSRMGRDVCRVRTRDSSRSTLWLC